MTDDPGAPGEPQPGRPQPGQRYAVSGPAGPGTARERRLVGLLVVALVAFLGVAIAKPWDAGLAPGASAAPPASLVTAGPASPPASRAATRTGPLPVAFTTAAPPASGAWLGLRWRLLAPDDPVQLVTAVDAWRGGFVAVGATGAGAASTPVWTSSDGARWEPLPVNTSETFWPGSHVQGVADAGGALVALADIPSACGGQPSCSSGRVAMAWSSTDGRAWSPHALPAFVAAAGSGVRFAPGPAGVIATPGGRGAPLAATTDGEHWIALHADALPPTFILNDLEAGPDGYVAAGLRVARDLRWLPATMWSADGRHWSAATLPVASPGTAGDTAVLSVLAGARGVLAIGRAVAWPGADVWWQSADGRSWREQPGFPPIGPVTCGSLRCTTEPHGWLAADGSRFVAVRSGTDPAAWTSLDGEVWQPLELTGDVPHDQPTSVALLPGGLLVTAGTTSWFGAPVVR